MTRHSNCSTASRTSGATPESNRNVNNNQLGSPSEKAEADKEDVEGMAWTSQEHRQQDQVDGAVTRDHSQRPRFNHLTVPERRLLRTCRRNKSGDRVTQGSGLIGHEKPAHLVQKRNARERRRVHAVNVAFTRLRRALPQETRGKRVSKVKTLQYAIFYIGHMRRLLYEHNLATSYVTMETSQYQTAQCYSQLYYSPADDYDRKE